MVHAKYSPGPLDFRCPLNLCFQMSSEPVFLDVLEDMVDSKSGTEMHKFPLNVPLLRGLD